MRQRSGIIDEAAHDTNRDFVKVVSRAFDVMHCFEGPGALLGNQDISHRTGLPPSTVSRLTYTLACIGHLSYVAPLQRYRLGAGAIAMSSALLRGLDLRGIVRPAMQSLAEQVPGTVGLSVRDRTDMVFLEYARSARAIGLFSVVGTRVSLALSAAGRAHIAAMSPDARAQLLAELEAQQPKPAAKLCDWLAHGLPQLQSRGYVVSCREWNPHISGIAMPIAHTATQSVFVLGIGVLSSVYDTDRLRAEVAPLLLDAGRRVASLLNNADSRPLTPPEPGLPWSSTPS